MNVILSYLVDEAPVGIGVETAASRHDVRQRILRALDEPLDPDEAKRWRRDRWGLDEAEAVATEQRLSRDGEDVIDLDEARARMRTAAAGDPP